MQFTGNLILFSNEFVYFYRMQHKNLLLFFFLLLSFFAGKVSAQPVSAYTDFQDHFMVWDNGMVREAESLPPIQYAIGRIAIPYIDNSRNFKIYYHGGSTLINAGFTNSFQTSDDLIAFQNANSLNVWDKGTVTNLSRYCQQYLVGDSVILFFEGVSKEYRAYYDGHIYPIEGFLAATNSQTLFSPDTANAPVSSDLEIASGQLPSVKVSDNIVAYVNYANQFHIFFHGYIINQENYLIENFDVGRNVVAYVDANQQFKIFYNGKTRIIDNFAPENYEAGDNLVAFITNNEEFKIFYDDSVYDMGYLQPNYLVKDNVVAFENSSGKFDVFYKGQIYEIDNYYPGNSNIKAGYNSLAYIDQNNELRLFTAGKTYDVTSANISSWRLDYDVLQYKFGKDFYKVFYEGRTY